MSKVELQEHLRKVDTNELECDTNEPWITWVVFDAQFDQPISLIIR